MPKLFASLLLIIMAVIFSGCLPQGTIENKNAPIVNTNTTNNTNNTNEVILGKKLDLSGQNLTQVPMSVFNKTQLEELDLSGNRLTGALPAEIRHLGNLRVLDASDNQMTGVPAEIGQLRNLITLDLSNNQLTGLPYELGNLSRLKTFNLSGNSYSLKDLEMISATLPNTNIIK